MSGWTADLMARCCSLLPRSDRRIARVPSFLILCLLFLPAAAFSQMNTAELTGTVADPSGATIPGASVSALNLETQAKFSAATNESGAYLISQLPPGAYTITDSSGLIH